MLRSAKELTGYVIAAEDGEVGRVHDFLLEDATWTLRYMVADTRKWLPGRKVLISPIALGEPEWRAGRFPVRLTQAQIEASPDLDEHAPVSRQYEIWYHKHYGWPYYWAGGNLWATSTSPGALFASRPDLGDAGQPELEEPHLHALNEVVGYRVAARDGELGKVEDFIIDDENWNVRYAVIDTRVWLPGKRVLVPLARLESVEWRDRDMHVDLTREQIRDCPEYEPGAPINREYEERLYDFVGRPYRGE